MATVRNLPDCAIAELYHGGTMKTQQIITPEMAKAARGKLTQKESAERIGYHWRTIQNWELGKAKLRRPIYNEYLRVCAE